MPFTEGWQTVILSICLDRLHTQAVLRQHKSDNCSSRAGKFPALAGAIMHQIKTKEDREYGERDVGSEGEQVGGYD